MHTSAKACVSLFLMYSLKIVVENNDIGIIVFSVVLAFAMLIQPDNIIGLVVNYGISNTIVLEIL